MVQETQPSSPKLEQIENTPLRLRISEILREAILKGDLKPGDPLRESTLATQLKVSRAPVREAIRTLAEEGLVESIPYKGTMVRALTKQNVEEVYSLREVLEAFAIRRIIENPKVNLKLLETICKTMQELAAKGNRERLNAEDERFHQTVIHLAGHELLDTMWSTLSLRVRQIMSLRNQQNQNLMEIALNHPPIVAAMKARQLDRALELMRKHVHSAADLTLRHWLPEETTE